MTKLAIRIIVAEGDPAARSQLRNLLESEAGVQVVAECSQGRQTIASVRTHKPDLLLIDTHLPDANGFQILDEIPVDDRPFVVFTSTHDQHAIRAFEARALDYLLKPFQATRLHVVIERARSELLKAQDHHLRHRLLDLLTRAEGEATAQRRLVVKSGARLVFLEMEEIDWVEAAGNYVKLRVSAQSYLLREGIGHIAERLDPSRFVRIHRSIIVNVRRIKELRSGNRGEYIVVLKDGKELSCSRSYRARLQLLVSNA
jgi:two-component system LytT family response regulator